MVGKGGRFEDFLDALLTYESGIDPSKFADYANVSGHHDGYALQTKDGAPWVGHAERDQSTGSRRLVKAMSNKAHFTGVGLAWPDDVKDEKSAAAARYKVTNDLGFVGFQLGEAILISVGAYLPPTHTANGETLPAYYMWPEQGDSVFAGGARLVRYQVPGSPNAIFLTPVNTWTGGFTGVDGLHSFADLKTKDVQQRLIRWIMAFNLGIVISQYRSLAHVQSDAEAVAGILKTTFADPSRGGETVRVTLSGVLAAAHLIGAWGTARLLAHPTDPLHPDEIGTTALTYLARFEGYETPFDAPGPHEFTATAAYPETVDAGWSDAWIDIPEGTVPEAAKTIAMHWRRDHAAVVTVHGFRPRIDRLMFRGYLELTGSGVGGTSIVTTPVPGTRVRSPTRCCGSSMRRTGWTRRSGWPTSRRASWRRRTACWSARSIPWTGGRRTFLWRSPTSSSKPTSSWRPTE